MYKILVFFAIVIGSFGIWELTEATLGVGLIGFACLLGILARISQANEAKLKTKKLTTD